jgi:hypothetical protein
VGWWNSHLVVQVPPGSQVNILLPQGPFNGHAAPAKALFVRMSRDMTGIADLNTPKNIVTESAIKKYMKTLRDLWSI